MSLIDWLQGYPGLKDNQTLADYVAEAKAASRERHIVFLWLASMVYLFGLAHPLAALFGKNQVTFDEPFTHPNAHPKLIAVRYRMCEFRGRPYITHRRFVYSDERRNLNRSCLLVDVLEMCSALHKDLQQSCAFPNCWMGIVDRRTLGPFSWRRTYNGMIAFREEQNQDAPMLGFLRYELGFFTYRLTFGWREHQEYDRQWVIVGKLRGWYHSFDRLHFAAFAEKSIARIAGWLKVRKDP